MVAVAKIPVRMTVDEFLKWESGEGRYELVDGEPRAMAPASPIHAYLQNELGSIIRNHLNAQQNGCKALANPGVVPNLLSDHNVRITDLAVTCSPLLPGQAVVSDPVLVVEILSPSNQAKTWANVWAYTNIPSVQEILILRSDRVGADLLRRSPSGQWPKRPVTMVGGELELESIGFRFDLSVLYAETNPRL